MKRDKFNFAKLYADISAWIADPETMSLFHDEPKESVERYLSGQDSALSSRALEKLAAYSLAQAVTLCQTNLNLANNRLVQSVDWGLAGLRLKWPLVVKANKDGGGWGTLGTLPALSMLLSLAIVTDLESQAHELALMLERGIRHDFFGRKGSIAFAEYVIAMWARWQGREVSTGYEELLTGHVYGKLIRELDARDVSGLREAIVDACQFHVERSRSSTSRVTYEFDSQVYRIYPAEMFAFLKICHSLGVPEIGARNEILETPLAQLGTPEVLVLDPLLEELKGVLAEKLGEGVFEENRG